MTDPLAYLLGLEPSGIKFGLDNISLLVDRLGHPERAFHAVHIAGTNGKGSVTAMVDAALRAAGRRAGRYTSPHLVDVSERFVIDGRAVDADTLARAIADVRAVAEGLRAAADRPFLPTFFEVTTAVAFELFRRARVEVAVLETGLGGRLDATNVVAPLVTAITSIALDHERYLGNTLADIAREKAGIIKPGTPVVVGVLPPEAVGPIEQTAQVRGAELVYAADGVHVARVGTSTDGQDHSTIALMTPSRDYGVITLGLRGAHQIGNAVVAVRVLEAMAVRGIDVPPAAIVKGLESPDWPGRLDLRRLAGGREALLDAAHNPAGAAALASYLGEWSAERLPLVLAVMRDKDMSGVLGALVPVVSEIVLTRASNARSADPAALAAHVYALAPDLRATISSSPAEALALAWQRSRRIVVAGSIFLLGDVLREFSRT